MTNNTFHLAPAVLLAAALLSACRDKEKPRPDNPPAPNEEELITTLELHFHQMGGGEHKHFVWRDLDGDGGDPPMIMADTLTTGLTYHVSMEVLNEGATPVDSITAEILAEGDEHQFFFQVAGANVTVAYDDADANGDPIGLASTWTVGAASSGTVTVILRHQPNKGAPGVSGGDITNAGGETDIEVTFPLVVQ
ncbi:MAG: type 1 periplasmic binding fold superfamily protein [Flavobacteriales bacterium]